MNDRGMKKWKPFNSVISNRELLKTKEHIPLPSLSNYEIEEYEELLKGSMYTHSPIRVTFIENNLRLTMQDYVVSIDPRTKDIIFHSKKINFWQIEKVENRE